MAKYLFHTLFAALIWAGSVFPAQAYSRIKDVASFEGVRENVLVGYGLVVGLNGTGDNITSIAFTHRSLTGMLERMGVNTRQGDIKTKNVAAVMVTATLPPFGRSGSKIDVLVGAMGDAKSLQGGTLLVTPLMGADGEVYAVAQGSIAVGGFAAEGQGATVTRGVPTSGHISNGAIIEREIPFDFKGMSSIKLALRNPDFTTATRVADAINSYLGTLAAETVDSGTVQMNVPQYYQSDIVGLISNVERLRVAPDQTARVIINEQTGVIVISDDVRVSRVAIAQGNLTIRVTETPEVSQPNPFAYTGETAVVPRTQIEIDDQKDRRLDVVSGGVSLQELVDGLNSMGVGPRDMISILQAIKAAGALQADIEVM